jgi:NitT/TauT family transport system ATP-binding protein
MSLVSIRNIGKVYRTRADDITALTDINLEIESAEFVSLLGPSGCGKSTLIRCVAGLDKPTSGEILIRDKPVREPPEGLGVVFQRDVLLEWRTVLNNVLLPVVAQRLRADDWRQRARDLLAITGLADFECRYPWELSGGMRQRVSICRALLLDPSLLLMDEPFGALDALTRDELNLELQRVWMLQQKTVMFVTHSIAEAVFLADRVVVMSPRPGRILETIKIDLPRPRDLGLRESAAFAAYTRHIRHLFQQMGFLRSDNDASPESRSSGHAD